MPSEHRLCYISGPFAWFTSAALADQWGDDWNDAPYEHNAGEPYGHLIGRGDPYTIKKLAFDGPFERPEDLGASLSVQDLNAGRAAWLSYARWEQRPDGYCGPLAVQAGATMEEFEAFVRGLGGRVYREVKDAD